MSEFLGLTFRESHERLKQIIQWIGSKTESRILSWWVHQLRNYCLQSSNSHLKNRMQKSCKWILICGSACICNLFFRLFCIVPFFFSSSPSSKCFSFLCRSTFLTIQFSTGRFLTNFSANHPDAGWLAHIRQHNLCCTLLKEMTCKRSSWVSHKTRKTVAFCVFEDSKSNFVTQRPLSF